MGFTYGEYINRVYEQGLVRVYVYRVYETVFTYLFYCIWRIQCATYILLFILYTVLSVRGANYVMDMGMY